MRLRVLRVAPLGLDRDFNKYWYFDEHGSAFGFFGSGKMFVSSPDWKWGYYSSQEQLDQLIEHLNPKGERELALKHALQESYDQLSDSFKKLEKDLTLTLRQEESRRSERIRTTSKKQSFMQYTNKWAS
jgi:bromodomain adjacent to zinc finger domain protein 1A